MAHRCIQPPDRDQVVATMAVLADRVTSLMEAVTDWDARVHGATQSWTVTDLVRHMSMLPEVYMQASVDGPLAMSPTAAAMAETNARTLAVGADRARTDLPGNFRSDVPLLLEHLRTSDPQARLPFHAGLTLTPGELGGIAVTEWLVHGWELAKTIGVPWQIQPDHARLALAALQAVVPAWVDTEQAANHSGNYEVRLRGTEESLQWRFTNGALTTRPDAGVAFRPDTIIWAEPSALLLYFYRRTGLVPNALRGTLIAGGRRPLRALTMRRLVQPA